MKGEIPGQQEQKFDTLAIKTTKSGKLPTGGTQLTYEVISLQRTAQHLLLPPALVWEMSLPDDPTDAFKAIADELITKREDPSSIKSGFPLMPEKSDFVTLSVTLSRRTYGTMLSRKTKTSPHRRFLLLCMCEPHSFLQEERKENSDEPASGSNLQPIEP